jgi:hypothetical protein
MSITETGCEDVNSLRIQKNGILWVHWLALMLSRYPYVRILAQEEALQIFFMGFLRLSLNFSGFLPQNTP